MVRMQHVVLGFSIASLVLAAIGTIAIILSLSLWWYELEASIDAPLAVSFDIFCKFDWGGTDCELDLTTDDGDITVTQKEEWDSGGLLALYVFCLLFLLFAALCCLGADALSTLILIFIIRKRKLHFAFKISAMALTVLQVIFTLFAVGFFLLHPVAFAEETKDVDTNDQDQSFASLWYGYMNNASPYDGDQAGLSCDEGPCKEFAGSQDFKVPGLAGIEIKWGPGPGWILGWIAFAFGVLTAIVLAVTILLSRFVDYDDAPGENDDDAL